MHEDDESEFADMIPGVKRLRQDRINPYQQRHQQRGQQKFVPRAAAPSAARGVDHAPLGGSARDTFFATGLQKKLQRKIRQGQLRPEASLDLHGYRQHEALDALADFLGDVLAQNMRLVIIVHGQGYRSQSDAVLKPLVHRWLAAQGQVLAWCPAQPRDGAAGATYVYLRTS